MSAVNNYPKVLAAIDLNDNCAPIIERAIQQAGGTAGVTVVTVMEAWNMLLVAGGLDVGSQANVVSELHDRLQHNDEEKMRQIQNQYGLADEAAVLLEGKPAHEIKRYAEDHSIDLIVVGSHGRHGMGLLLGSISNAVLHGAPCDVLAVRV